MSAVVVTWYEQGWTVDGPVRCEAEFPAREQADQFADQLLKQGFTVTLRAAKP